MEENKPKKSFFRKWAQRLGLIFGIGASTLALGTSDAHAAALEDDREDNHIKVEEAIDHSTVAESNLQTDLDELMAKDGKMTFKGGSQILSEEAPEPIKFRVNSIEDASIENVEPVEIAENVSIEHDNEIVVSDVETRVKELLAESKFRNLRYLPHTLETDLSNEIVELQTKISQARYNGNKELAEMLTLKVNDLRAQRIALTEARLNQGVQHEISTDKLDFIDKKYISPEELNTLTYFVDNVSDDWTVGQKITNYAEGALRLEVTINGYIQNNNPDEFSIEDRENYYKVLDRLLTAYNTAKEQNEILAAQALENPSAPEYNLENPNVEKETASASVEEIDEAEVSNYSGLIDDRNENISADEFKTTEVEETQFEEVSEIEEVAEEPQTTGGLIDDRTEVSETEYTEADVTFDNVEIQDKPGVFKTRVIEDDEPVVTSRIINEEKLHDVSVGQMGDFDIKEEEVPQEIHSGKVDFEKIAEGVDQMGMWSEIEDVLDEEVEKLEAKTNKKNKSTKIVEVDDDFER